MTITVSGIAVQRYAQLFLGFGPDVHPRRAERKIIEAAIRLAVEKPGLGDMTSYRVRCPDAVYVVVQRRVVTVLHPSQEHARRVARRQQLDRITA